MDDWDNPRPFGVRRLPPAPPAPKRVVEIIQRGSYVAELEPGQRIVTEQDLIDAAVAALTSQGRERGRDTLRKMITVGSLAHRVIYIGQMSFTLVERER